MLTLGLQLRDPHLKRIDYFNIMIILHLALGQRRLRLVKKNSRRSKSTVPQVTILRKPDFR